MMIKLFSLFKQKQKKNKCCGHVNPPHAKFCGGCGLPLYVSTKPPDLSSHLTRQSGINKSRQIAIFHNKWITALLLITFNLTVIVTFASLLVNTQKVSAADGFRDISLDHPAYELAANLLRINAVNARPGGCFEPYEPILPKEWNYCINGLEKALDFGLPADCRFGEYDMVDSSSLQDKGRILAVFLSQEEPEFKAGISRIEAYNMIEQICFDGKLP